MRANNRKACQLIGWDRKNQADDKATGHCGFVPGGSDLFLWDMNAMAAGLFYVGERRSGQTVRLAGQGATRLLDGMRAFPDADQLAVVTLENGSKSILPIDALIEDGRLLASGFVSGALVTSALLIDARDLRARIEELVAGDAEIIGGGDE